MQREKRRPPSIRILCHYFIPVYYDYYYFKGSIRIAIKFANVFLHTSCLTLFLTYLLLLRLFICNILVQDI